MALWKKIILISATMLVLHGITGFLILPVVIKSLAQSELTKAIKRTVAIDNVSVNPYDLSLTVGGFTIMDEGGIAPFFSFESIHIDLDSSSFLKFAPMIEKFTVVRPYFRLIRLKDGSYNISDLLPQSPTAPRPENDEKKGLLNFTLARLTVQEGRVELQDQTIGTSHLIDRLNIDIPFISSMKLHGSTPVTPNFSMLVDGAPINLSGKIMPFSTSLETAMTMDIRDVHLNHYLSYLPMKTNIKKAGGRADLMMTLGFSKDPTGILDLVVSGELTLNDLSIETQNGETIFALEKFQAILAPSNPLAHSIHINTIAFDGPRLHLIRNEQGILNIDSLVIKPDDPVPADTVPTSSNATAQAKAPFDLTVTVDNTNVTQAALIITDSFKTKPPFPPREIASLGGLYLDLAVINMLEQRISLDKIAATKGIFTLLRLADSRLTIEPLMGTDKTTTNKEPEATAPPSAPWITEIREVAIDDFSLIGKGLAQPGRGDVTVDKLNLRLKDFSTLPGKKTAMNLDLKINTTGHFGANGKIGLDPLTADLNVDINAISLAWAQPFVTDYLNPMISNGRLTVNGNIAVENPGNPDGKASYTGNAAIMDMSLTDPLEGTEVIAWKKLELKKMNLGLSPIHATIGEVFLERPFGNIVIDNDKTINIQNLLKKSTAPEKANGGESRSSEIKSDKKERLEQNAASEAADNTSFDLTIDRIVLTGGDLHFKDRSIEPEFKTNLGSIDTTLNNINLQTTEKSDFDFNARVNNHAQLKAKGQVHPIRDALFLDTRISLDNMDLGPVSPYAGKYAGYTIQQGKLSMDLNYRIDSGQLEAKNNVELDLFNFGEPTNSDDAIKAPVKLALALLKDTKGRVELNLPVKGNLNDPEFSVGGIILNMIMNLMAKAATSPFALLGSMFGGQENLDVIEFTPGSATPTPQSLEKLTVLTKALQERPGLGLEITGHADLEQDRRSIEDQRFLRKLKALKLSRLVKQGGTAVPVDEISLTNGEHDEYLEAAYTKILTQPKAAENGKGGVTPRKNQSDKTLHDPETMESVVRKTIIVTNNDLGHLARDRAAAVADKIVNMGEIDGRRIFMKEPTGLESPKADGHPATSVIMKLR